MIINQVVQGGGTTPTGSISITNNGTYDVTDKASADVNVPTTAPALYREFQLDANGVLVPNTTTTHIMSFAGVKNISEYALIKAYYNNTQITGSVDMSDLITVSESMAMYQCFFGCSGITGIVLSALTTISGNNALLGCFQYTGITSVAFPSLTTASGDNCMDSMFFGCTGLTSITFPLLSIISGRRALRTAFAACTNLTSLYFPALTSTSFGSNTNQFYNMLSGVTGCTVHFPSNLQSVIGSWSDVTNGFGGTNTTVLFDLTATS